MKKLLKMIAAVSLSIGSTVGVVACVNDDDSFQVFKEIKIASTMYSKNASDPKINVLANKFHVDTPDFRGMLNDIQGAFFLDGVWHVYFLYNWEAKYDTNGSQIGGNGTEWYHVTTTDWLHWEYKGIAVKKWNDWGDAASGSLYQDVDGDFGAVVSKDKTKEESKGGYVAFTTAYGGDRGQNIMAYYSSKEDAGNNFSLIKEEPILKNNQPLGKYPDFRDPLVLKKDGKFIMYVAQGTFFGIYAADEPLGEYKKIGEYKPIHGMIECGNLFQLNVNSNKDLKKWVFIYGGNGNNDNTTPSEADGLGTGTYYAVGHLDNNGIFVEEQAPKRLDFGADFYAAKFWADNSTTSNNNDYLIGTGWMSSWDYNTKVPNIGYWGNMSLARKIKLVKANAENYSLTSEFLGFDKLPVSSQGDASSIGVDQLEGKNFKLSLDLKNIQNIDNKSEFIFSDESYEIKFRLDFQKGLIYTKRSTTYEPLVENKGFTQIRKYKVDLNNLSSIKVEFIVDSSTIEATMPDGSTISVAKFPSGGSVENLNLKTSTDIDFSYIYYQL